MIVGSGCAAAATGKLATIMLSATTINALFAMSFLPRGCAARSLLPFVGADQFTLRDRVLGRLILDIGHLCTRSKIQLVDIEREQLEMIMVRSVAFGWAGAAVTGLAEVV